MIRDILYYFNNSIRLDFMYLRPEIFPMASIRIIYIPDAFPSAFQSISKYFAGSLPL